MSNIDKATLEHIAPSLVELAERRAWKLQLHHLGRVLNDIKCKRAMPAQAIAEYAQTVQGIADVRKFVTAEICEGNMLSEEDIEETFEVKS